MNFLKDPIPAMAEAYSRLPKPIRFVLYPLTTICFVAVAIPLLLITRTISALITTYEEFDK